MMLLLIILVLGSAYFLVSGLRDAYGETTKSRNDDHDARVLRQARDALIAWSALRGYQPGALPCPDTDGDGYADVDFAAPAGVPDPVLVPSDDVTWQNSSNAGGFCSTDSRRVGRLPWKTLGLPDLRDASGERLWYAMSDPFRALLARKINSDSQGDLTITGVSPAANVLAIVFAPGSALPGQDRSAAGRNNAVNYLEGENSSPLDKVFVIATRSDTFNDTLLPVRAEEFFPVLENAVLHRIATEIRPILFERRLSDGSLTTVYADKGHYQRWRENAGVANQEYFPFAAGFVQPDTSTFKGVWDELDGLMPVTTDSTFVTWDATSASWTESGGPLVDPTSTCSVSGSLLVCDFKYTNSTTPTVQISAVIRNVASAFVDPVQVTDVKYCQPLPCTPASVLVGPPIVTNALITSGMQQGGAQVIVQTMLPSSSNSATSFVRVGVPITFNAQLASSWFLRNNWQYVTFYAVSPSYVAGGAKPCNAASPPRCISIASYRGSGSSSDKELVLILAGRALGTGAARPTGVLSRYLEGVNASWSPGTPTFDFENAVRTTTKNDKVAVIAP